MKNWFKGKHKGLPDNLDTPIIPSKKTHQNEVNNNNNASTYPVSTIPENSTMMYGSSDRPATAYPYHLNTQGSSKLNAGNNINKSGSQTSGGIKLVTTNCNHKYEVNTGHNINEGETQVSSGIDYCEVDGDERP